MKITDLFRRIETIAASDARKLMDEKKAEELQVIDVREPAEYEKGHIPGATFIPLSLLPSRLNDVDPSKPVITYCARGRRSASAASLLKGNGVNEVYSLDGGIEAWNGNIAKGEPESGMFLVEGLQTIDEYAALAWALEDGTGRFYKAAIDVIDDSGAADLFTLLLSAEDKHKSSILNAFKDLKGTDISASYLEEMASKGVMEGGVQLKDALVWLREDGRSLPDILELSMQLETNSLDLYFKIMNEIEEGHAREIFISIIEDEKTHLKRLGNLLEKTV
jgi:rhodanese-related sulfurtransferase/rubrerythrin